jgi:hypothetical protein
MDMVNAVVEVLDEGKGPFMDRQRVLHSRIPKKRPRQRVIKPVQSSPPGGHQDTGDKSKERIRKIVKKQNPDQSMKWDGMKWVQRRLDSSYYSSRTNERLEKLHYLEQKMTELKEISLRTISSVGSLAKMRQHQNRVKSGVQKMNSLASALKSAPDDIQRNRIDSQWRKEKGKVDAALADMEWWSAFLTLSGSFGLEKSLIKKLKNIKRR